MSPHFLALPLPSSIRSELARFCYGLPQVRWVPEENLHLTLRYLGPLSSSQVEEVQERLKGLFFHPFSLKLEGVGHFQGKGRHGVIWVGIRENTFVSSLKKNMDLLLRDLSLPSDPRPFHPHVTLGRFERLHPNRLHDYLLAQGSYQSADILIPSCQLLQSRQTPKQVIYEIIEEYFAVEPETGED